MDEVDFLSKSAMAPYEIRWHLISTQIHCPSSH